MCYVTYPYLALQWCKPSSNHTQYFPLRDFLENHFKLPNCTHNAMFGYVFSDSSLLLSLNFQMCASFLATYHLCHYSQYFFRVSFRVGWGPLGFWKKYMIKAELLIKAYHQSSAWPHGLCQPPKHSITFISPPLHNSLMKHCFFVCLMYQRRRYLLSKGTSFIWLTNCFWRSFISEVLQQCHIPHKQFSIFFMRIFIVKTFVVFIKLWNFLL